MDKKAISARLEDEILTPLTIIKVSAEEMQERSAEDVKTEAKMILAQVKRIQKSTIAFAEELRRKNYV